MSYVNIIISGFDFILLQIVLQDGVSFNNKSLNRPSFKSKRPVKDSNYGLLTFW